MESLRKRLLHLSFQSRNPRGMAQMKNIPPSTLPNFNGMESEESRYISIQIQCPLQELQLCLRCLKIETIPYHIEKCNATLVYGTQWK
jgi:hypothetical protein